MSLIGSAAVCPAARCRRIHDGFNWAPSTHRKRGSVAVPLREMAASGGCWDPEYLPLYLRGAEMFSDVISHSFRCPWSSHTCLIRQTRGMFLRGKLSEAVIGITLQTIVEVILEFLINIHPEQTNTDKMQLTEAIIEQHRPISMSPFRGDLKSGASILQAKHFLLCPHRTLHVYFSLVIVAKGPE